MMAVTINHRLTIGVTMTEVALSPYQQAFIEWLDNGSGNCVLKATAGSGKTFTLGVGSKRIPQGKTAVYLAFGRANADEAKGKFSIPCSTFHSMTFRALGAFFKSRFGFFVKTEKPNNERIIDELWGRNIDDIRSVVSRLASLAKGENLAPADATNDVLTDLLERFDLDWDSPDFTLWDVCDATRKLLAECCNLDGIKRRRSVDFDDQLWLVERFNVKLETFDYVMVDEAQDTNVIQRAILRRVSKPTTRLIAVGDDCQAIYGFRGASHDALDQIVSDFQATVLPLSVSYRCPRAVVEFASKYGTIEAAPNAIDGSVTFPEKIKLEDVGKLQLVLCRNTAPLISLAYRLIARRIPVAIRGRDIGVGLKSLITKLAGKRGTLETLPEKIATYGEREQARALAARNETKAQSIADKCESIMALIDSLTEDECSRGIPGLLGAIDELFGIGKPADAGINGKLCLSTVHKAKGLEAHRVGILDWSLMPSKYAKRDDQRRQERNLQFVAVTRSLDSLVIFETTAISQD